MYDIYINDISCIEQKKMCIRDSSGYTPLSQNPEIISAVNKTANLIAGMTIHLMENTENGDQRLINELSRKIDINPNPYMTRATFISALVRILLLEGDGNAVIYPETRNGLIDGLYILPPGQVSFIPDGFGYYMMYNGVKYTCDELVHIPINPDPVLDVYKRQTLSCIVIVV